MHNKCATLVHFGIHKHTCDGFLLLHGDNLYRKVGNGRSDQTTKNKLAPFPGGWHPIHVAKEAMHFCTVAQLTKIFFIPQLPFLAACRCQVLPNVIGGWALGLDGD